MARVPGGRGCFCIGMAGCLGLVEGAPGNTEVYGYSSFGAFYDSALYCVHGMDFVYAETGAAGTNGSSGGNRRGRRFSLWRGWSWL